MQNNSYADGYSEQYLRDQINDLNEMIIKLERNVVDTKSRYPEFLASELIRLNKRINDAKIYISNSNKDNPEKSENIYAFEIKTMRKIDLLCQDLKRPDYSLIQKSEGNTQESDNNEYLAAINQFKQQLLTSYDALQTDISRLSDNINKTISKIKTLNTIPDLTISQLKSVVSSQNQQLLDLQKLFNEAIIEQREAQQVSTIVERKEVQSTMQNDSHDLSQDLNDLTAKTSGVISLFNQEFSSIETSFSIYKDSLDKSVIQFQELYDKQNYLETKINTFDDISSKISDFVEDYKDDSQGIDIEEVLTNEDSEIESLRRENVELNKIISELKKGRNQ